jgi:hypothetical protein
MTDVLPILFLVASRAVTSCRIVYLYEMTARECQGAGTMAENWF